VTLFIENTKTKHIPWCQINIHKLYKSASTLTQVSWCYVLKCSVTYI